MSTEITPQDTKSPVRSSFTALIVVSGILLAILCVYDLVLGGLNSSEPASVNPGRAAFQATLVWSAIPSIIGWWVALLVGLQPRHRQHAWRLALGALVFMIAVHAIAHGIYDSAYPVTSD